MLAALGVDASTPDAVRAALERHERDSSRIASSHRRAALRRAHRLRVSGAALQRLPCGVIRVIRVIRQGRRSRAPPRPRCRARPHFRLRFPLRGRARRASRRHRPARRHRQRRDPRLGPRHRAAVRCAHPVRARPRRPRGPQHAHRRPRALPRPQGAARPRARSRRAGAALLPALLALLGHGRPRRPQRPRRVGGAHAGRRLHPAQPAAQRGTGGCGRADGPLPVPPLLAVLPRPRTPADRGDPRVRLPRRGRPAAGCRAALARRGTAGRGAAQGRLHRAGRRVGPQAGGAGAGAQGPARAE